VRHGRHHTVCPVHGGLRDGERARHLLRPSSTPGGRWA
jgi:hypothetical protein